MTSIILIWICHCYNDNHNSNDLVDTYNNQNSDLSSEVDELLWKKILDRNYVEQRNIFSPKEIITEIIDVVEDLEIPSKIKRLDRYCEKKINEKLSNLNKIMEDSNLDKNAYLKTQFKNILPLLKIPLIIIFSAVFLLLNQFTNGILVYSIVIIGSLFCKIIMKSIRCKNVSTYLKLCSNYFSYDTHDYIIYK
ncbi:variable surface protein [Plasmodium gonderi]|uniref:Variable surface protein n=1 Tax=Plasmodium gonderi TaxID=77519 RepID=A0A1Y1JNL7_PLAGO|nr:variable surface protein [Plasmodium gonderi]GAW84059.1 variable surface protein [Plasmodium gonderi]